jgi:hypothetical protein
LGTNSGALVSGTFAEICASKLVSPSTIGGGPSLATGQPDSVQEGISKTRSSLGPKISLKNTLIPHSSLVASPLLPVPATAPPSPETAALEPPDQPFAMISLPVNGATDPLEGGADGSLLTLATPSFSTEGLQGSESFGSMLSTPHQAQSSAGTAVQQLRQPSAPLAPSLSSSDPNRSPSPLALDLSAAGTPPAENVSPRVDGTSNNGQDTNPSDSHGWAGSVTAMMLEQFHAPATGDAPSSSASALPEAASPASPPSNSEAVRSSTQPAGTAAVQSSSSLPEIVFAAETPTPNTEPDVPVSPFISPVTQQPVTQQIDRKPSLDEPAVPATVPASSKPESSLAPTSAGALHPFACNITPSPLMDSDPNVAPAEAPSHPLRASSLASSAVLLPPSAEKSGESRTSTDLTTVNSGPGATITANSISQVPTEESTGTKKDSKPGGSRDTSPDSTQHKGPVSALETPIAPSAPSTSAAVAALADPALQKMPGNSLGPLTPQLNRDVPSASPDSPLRLRVQVPDDAKASPIQLAQIVSKTARSEMRIGLNTSAFGNVEVRTVVRANDVGLLIGSEKGDLRSLLANDLPGITNTLQQQNLQLTQVNFHQTGFASSNDLSSGGNSQPHSFAPKPDSVTHFSRESSSASSSETEPLSTVVGSGLSILA